MSLPERMWFDPLNKMATADPAEDFAHDPALIEQCGLYISAAWLRAVVGTMRTLDNVAGDHDHDDCYDDVLALLNEAP